MLCTRQAPLAQSAERLHGKNPARIAVLTSENALHLRPLCTQLDALEAGLSLRLDVTQVTEIRVGCYWCVTALGSLVNLTHSNRGSHRGS